MIPYAVGLDLDDPIVEARPQDESGLKAAIPRWDRDPATGLCSVSGVVAVVAHHLIPPRWRRDSVLLGAGDTILSGGWG